MININFKVEISEEDLKNIVCNYLRQSLNSTVIGTNNIKFIMDDNNRLHCEALCKNNDIIAETKW